MVPQHLEDRKARLGPALLDARELGALGQTDTDERPDADQRDADEERNAPAPAQEGVLGQARREREDPGRQEQPGRRPRLRPAAVEAAPPRGRVLGRHEHRAAPFAPEAEALHQTQRHEEDRGPNADLGVGREEADGERRHAHDEEREAEHRLPPDPVAVVAEDDSAHGTRDEAHRERREREDGADQRIEAREEQLVEDQRGGGPVEEEVVPLDRGAHEARDGNVGDRGRRRDGGDPLAGYGQGDVEHARARARPGPCTLRAEKRVDCEGARQARRARRASVRVARDAVRSAWRAAHTVVGPLASSGDGARRRRVATVTVRLASAGDGTPDPRAGARDALRVRPAFRRRLEDRRGARAAARLVRGRRRCVLGRGRRRGSPARDVRRVACRPRDVRAPEDVPAGRGERPRPGQATAGRVRGLDAGARRPSHRTRHHRADDPRQFAISTRRATALDVRGSGNRCRRAARAARGAAVRELCWGYVRDL